MRRRAPILLLLAAVFLAGGCTSVLKSSEFGNVKVDGGRTPAAVVEIENSVWLFLNFIPLASGDPERPNENACRFLRNTVNLENNMKVLKREMQAEGVVTVANLTSRYSDEKYLFFILARRACHTSAVLVKDGTGEDGNAKESK